MNGKFGLPSQTTLESLELNWNTVLPFGDKVLLAGYVFNGPSKNCYFGAVYDVLTENTTCEGNLKLKSVSDVEFDNNGPAITWALRQCSEKEYANFLKERIIHNDGLGMKIKDTDIGIIERICNSCARGFVTVDDAMKRLVEVGNRI